MKTNRFYSILSILMIAITFTSCVEDGNFETPDVSITEPNITTDATVAKIQTDLIQEYNLNGSLTYTYRENDIPTYASGYVVSSDAAGNFYQTLVIQDAIENPTAGVEVMINNSSLSESYEIGRKVYIKLDGLTVTYDDGQSTTRIDPTDNEPGKFSVGIIDHTGQVENIPSTTYREYIVRSSSVETIIPTKVKLVDVEQKHVNTLIKIEGSQFAKNQINKTFSDEPNDSFDGFRTIFECDTEATMLLQSSTFASFSSNLLPSGKGDATVVLSKDFRSEFFVLIVSSPADLEFSNPDRCDPPILDCDGNAVVGNIVVFEEDFDGITSTSALTTAGWTNVNVNGGSNLFSSRSFSGNRYVQVSAFRSGEDPMEAWLITPTINLDSSTDEALSFETKTGFNNGAALSVWVSSDFTGNITTSTWLQVDAIIADGPSNGYQSSFTNSGLVNLSCLSGNVHVAFKYLGADGGVTTTFQVENVKVIGN